MASRRLSHASDTPTASTIGLAELGLRPPRTHVASDFEMSSKSRAARRRRSASPDARLCTNSDLVATQLHIETGAHIAFARAATARSGVSRVSTAARSRRRLRARSRG